jgi:SAM-dependent methyltransferase
VATGAGFQDHFSSVADAYAQARPEYPDALFDLLAARVPAGAQVWEPGCGSGQATRGLALRFAHVHATDPSAQQIARHWAAPHDPGVPAEAAVSRDADLLGPDAAQGLARALAHGHVPGHAPVREAAFAHPPGQDTAPARVTVAVEPGERTALPDASVQLIAVAQALHWFDRPAFFAECDRVLAPGGVLAAWGYGDFLVPEGMEDAVAAFRADIEPHWPPERVLVDGEYGDFAWPFPAEAAPRLALEASWTLPHFLRYLASMSAVVRCTRATGQDPVARHRSALAQAWGDPERGRVIAWPLFLHVRRKPGPPA